MARQLRLRDLSGLIVIDFIDMDISKNQRGVERRLKEAVKTDRARIQLGRISNFGLFELSRQRMRPSIVEYSTETCIHCGGTGYVRSTESTAVHVLRSIEEEGIRNRSIEIAVTVPTAIALYILNQKRESLNQIEKRYDFRVQVFGDDSLVPPDMRLERVQNRLTNDNEDNKETESNDSPSDEEKNGKRKRRPRRRRKKTLSKNTRPEESETNDSTANIETEKKSIEEDNSEDTPNDRENRTPRRRRRGRRGGRRRSQKEQIADNLINNESSAQTKESKNSEPDQNLDPTIQSAKKEIKEKKDSNLGKAETKPEGPPKRGWWQRITR